MTTQIKSEYEILKEHEILFKDLVLISLELKAKQIKANNKIYR